MQNTRGLGMVLYDRYALMFQMAGLILLVSMIGAILLTMRHRKDIKRQNVLEQMWRDPAKQLELKDIKPGQGYELSPAPLCDRHHDHGLCGLFGPRCRRLGEGLRPSGYRGRYGRAPESGWRLCRRRGGYGTPAGEGSYYQVTDCRSAKEITLIAQHQASGAADGVLPPRVDKQAEVAAHPDAAGGERAALAGRAFRHGGRGEGDRTALSAGPAVLRLSGILSRIARQPAALCGADAMTGALPHHAFIGTTARVRVGRGPTANNNMPQGN